MIFIGVVNGRDLPFCMPLLRSLRYGTPESVKPVNKPRSLGTILSTNSHLQSLLSQARQNTDLLLQVRGALPAGVRDHCLAAHLTNAQLVLFTDSPAWVMRLRFSSQALTDALRKTGVTVQGVRVRVQLSEQRSRRRQQPARLSEPARRQLLDAADTLENPALAEALRRLGTTRRRG